MQQRRFIEEDIGDAKRLREMYKKRQADLEKVFHEAQHPRSIKSTFVQDSIEREKQIIKENSVRPADLDTARSHPKHRTPRKGCQPRGQQSICGLPTQSDAPVEAALPAW